MTPRKRPPKPGTPDRERWEARKRRRYERREGDATAARDGGGPIYHPWDGGAIRAQG